MDALGNCCDSCQSGGGCVYARRKRQQQQHWKYFLTGLPPSLDTHKDPDQGQAHLPKVYLVKGIWGTDGSVEGRGHEGKEWRRHSFHPMQGTLPCVSYAAFGSSGQACIPGPALPCPKWGLFFESPSCTEHLLCQ